MSAVYFKYCDFQTFLHISVRKHQKRSFSCVLELGENRCFRFSRELEPHNNVKVWAGFLPADDWQKLVRLQRLQRAKQEGTVGPFFLLVAPEDFGTVQLQADI